MDTKISQETTKQTEAHNKEKQRQEQQLVRDFEAMLSDPAGQRVIWHLLERCHVWASTFTGNSRTYFLEGERNIGLHILTKIQMSGPGGLAKLQKLKPEKEL